MKFINLVSQRYIFSRKNHNTINLITSVAMCGVCVSVMAIIIILSVINGIEIYVKDSFSLLDPQLKIVRLDRNIFSVNDSIIAHALDNENIENYCKCIEHEGMIVYGNEQLPIKIKGVDRNYSKLYSADSLIIDGHMAFTSRAYETIIIGYGLANTLNLSVQYDKPASIYSAKRNAKINLTRPENAFSKKEVYVSGIMNMGQSDLNDQLCIIPINTARDMFEYEDNTASYIEIKLKNNADTKQVKNTIKNILNDEFAVLDRYEQQSDFYKILRIEKWVTFLILTFILLIAIFNVVGGLTMIMIEKKNDISLFIYIGATTDNITKIFTRTGWLITCIGGVIGLILGTTICLIQEYFGFIKMGSFNETYPILVDCSDIIIITITVMIMGYATSFFAVKSSLKGISSTSNKL